MIDLEENITYAKSIIISTERLCGFLNTAWIEGWMDEYSDNHFLIKVIENRLETFVGKEQLIENDLNM